jgi:hypothetical protein
LGSTSPAGALASHEKDDRTVEEGSEDVSEGVGAVDTPRETLLFVLDFEDSLQEIN